MIVLFPKRTYSSSSVVSVVILVAITMQDSNSINSSSSSSSSHNGNTSLQKEYQSSSSSSSSSYGVDCSFPVHSFNKLKCDDGSSPLFLSNRQTVYDHFIDGCQPKYGTELCSKYEQHRNDQNLIQPQHAVVRAAAVQLVEK